ncbi:flap endonuclease-1 [Candidatus Woesearchaeota archaeon]|nr:flap endonuclease-1 [Candidatus Woesearchaeota archaeon]
MGCAITDLLISHTIELGDLKKKKLMIDAYNMLYQFLTTIRQADGTPLMDSKGRITSHLTGLFNRTTRFMSLGMKLAFVFDGEVPELKYAELSKRKSRKEEAHKKHKEAVEKKDIESMKKYATRTTRLTGQMIEESKDLLEALGTPVIQAPSEGEAQAAYIVKQKDAYAVVSQDADCLLFGSPKLVKNLSVAGRKKMPGRMAYVSVTPELIELKENLKNLELSQDQLIALGLLVGTDFNPGGVKGIGPKKGLKLVQEHGKDFDSLFKKAGWDFEFDWDVPFNVIKNMPVEKKYKLKWKVIDRKKVLKILCDKHDFSEERVSKKLDEVSSKQEKAKQKGLKQWF